MNRKITIIIALQALLIVMLFWLLVFYGKDEYEAAIADSEEGITTRSLVAPNDIADNGAATLILSPGTQQQSGIITTKLQGTTHKNTVASFGSVESIEALVNLRTRYLEAIAEGNVTRTRIVHDQQNFQRLTLLNQDNRNVSDRAVQEAEATLKNDKAKLIATETLATGIRDNIRQQWGTTLEQWAIQTNNDHAFQALLQYQQVLLKVTLPFNITPTKNTALLIAPIGINGQNVKAQFISAAPQTDATLPGKTYFYHAPANQLRAGMRVTVHLDSADQAITGVIVPHEAVVWYANQAWVYQQLGHDKFIRRPISTEIEINHEHINGWFNATQLKLGDRLVSRGAQLLLSEELKYQIKNENED